MNWIKKAPIAITVTDKEGKIMEANDKAKEVFKRFGDFVGKNLKDCHNEKSKEKIKDMFEKKHINAYTIEKKGVKKLIYQFPWYDDNGFGGYVELSIELPANMPHFVREK